MSTTAILAAHILTMSISINGTPAKDTRVLYPSQDACMTAARAANDITQVPGQYEILRISCKVAPAKVVRPPEVFIRGTAPSKADKPAHGKAGSLV